MEGGGFERTHMSVRIIYYVFCD
eukprot:COSAG01_NODE_4364_length_5094_cov_26.560561_1_plen_22_part_10